LQSRRRASSCCPARTPCCRPRRICICICHALLPAARAPCCRPRRHCQQGQSRVESSRVLKGQVKVKARSGVEASTSHLATTRPDETGFGRSCPACGPCGLSRVHMYVHAHVDACECTCACSCACSCGRLRVHMRMLICMLMWTLASAHAHAHLHAHVDACVDSHAYGLLMWTPMVDPHVRWAGSLCGLSRVPRDAISQMGGGVSHVNGLTLFLDSLTSSGHSVEQRPRHRQCDRAAPPGPGVAATDIFYIYAVL